MVGLSRTHFIYDYAGIARAHPLLRIERRPWLHGLEAWESMRPEIGAALRRADLVLVNSNYTLARFEHLHGSLPRGRVCWLATEEDDSSCEVASFSNPPTALILARLWKEEGGKGHAG
jgi:phosphatidyl-myo-inositol dimannoside synthase